MAAAEGIPEELRIDWDDDDGADASPHGGLAAGDGSAQSWGQHAAQDLESLEGLAAPSQGGLAASPPDLEAASGSATTPRGGTGSGRPEGSPRDPETKRPGADDFEDLLVDALGEEEAAVKPPAKRMGRPPAHPRLVLSDEATVSLLAERGLGLTSNEIVLDDLDCSREELLAFMRRRGVKAAIQRRMYELQQSGEVARRRANVGLHAGITRMSEIIRDPDIGPQAQIGATGMLSKIGATNGRQQQAREERGPQFSITLNLGGEEPMRVETDDVIEGEVDRG